MSGILGLRKAMPSRREALALGAGSAALAAGLLAGCGSGGSADPGTGEDGQPKRVVMVISSPKNDGGWG